MADVRDAKKMADARDEKMMAAARSVLHRGSRGMIMSS